MRTPIYFAVAFWATLPIYGASPPVQVELRSSWPAPPFLLEVLEAIAIEEPQAYYPLLDIITNPELLPNPAPVTQHAVHKHVLDTAVAEGYLSAPGVLSAVEMNLGLHMALPKLEAYYQYYRDRHVARHNALNREDCDSWVDWYGQIICDVQTLAHIAGTDSIDGPEQQSNINICHRTPSSSKLLSFDRVSPNPAETVERPPRVAILYGSPTSPNFRALHSYLYRASTSDAPTLQYVFRPIPEKDLDFSRKTYLSGFGAALDLKKMEYLALDDRGQAASSSEHLTPDNVAGITLETDTIASLLQQYPENSTADYTATLSSEELLQIGFQATQLIHDSDQPLATLKRIAQNFPKYASSVARRVVVDDNLQNEVTENHAKAQPGVSMMWLNGVVVPEKDINPFTLLRLLRKERGVMLSLTSLGLSPSQALDLLTHNAVSAAQSGSSVLDGIFDASDRQEGGGLITWWNDFEKDARYARWGTSLRLLLRPMYPGQMPNIKRNIFNVVLAVDLSHSSSLNFLAGPVSNIISRNFPYRFGVVPIVETEEGIRMARLIFWLVEHIGAERTLNFVRRIAQMQTPIDQLTPTVNWQLVTSEFKTLRSEIENLPATSLEDILSDAAGKYAETIEKAQHYSKRLGADLFSAPQGHAFINGKHFNLDDDFLRNMQSETGQQMQYLQEQLYLTTLDDANADTIDTYFYDLPESNKRRNKHIYPSGKGDNLKTINLAELHRSSGFPATPGSFVYPPDTEKVPLTMYVVADLDSPSGLALIREALNSITEDGISRITFVHNPSANSNSAPWKHRVSSLLGQLIGTGLLDKVSASRLLDALHPERLDVTDSDSQTVFVPEGYLDTILENAIIEDPQQTYESFAKASRFFVRELNIAPGNNAFIVNGRIVGPFASDDFVKEDINALAQYEFRKRVRPVVEALPDVIDSFDSETRDRFAELVSVLSSIISNIQQPDPSEAGLFNTPHRPRRRNYRMLAGEHTKFTFGDNSTALFQFGVLLDPLSEAAQKWSSLIEWLLHDPAVYIELHINPPRYRELPLKRFYRFNLPAKLQYDEAGNEVRSKITFDGLPVEPIYTLAMDVAQSWLVRPREALYDLDNLQLGVLAGPDRVKGVQAVFELDYLVIEGHARDILTNAPPRGLQLQLTDSNGTAIADTLVVANLGYLQFRTKPGVFRLEIRPGRGREIFRMDSVGNEGWDSPSVEEVGDEVTLTNFEGLTLYPRVARLPGMERVDVLASPEDEHDNEGFVSGVVSKLSSIFHKSKPETDVAVSGSPHADINIFTVASGLLYERFASIMILSVLRNTKSSVKFWFIENFLSPAFLEFIPHFAAAYNFQYELVTYKWPSWLRPQREKQRIIWAYKILFLDVLFPMDLKKVIFVDADQIVRADLIELVNLDLHGAPYGYTPMGDDNTEMEGFRFWKTGYWRDFLQGLPYHIRRNGNLTYPNFVDSALYVVDLVRFRQIAAGDILRSHYQQLSADPNSLANLDQDLPNNLQREVPIYSLPEDWLWCETWCSKDRLHRAKTIDLCQNPLTKEPKLSRARQIPEWSTYDAEISQFARSLADKGLIRSGIVAADANVLADVSAGKAQAGSIPSAAAEHEEGSVAESDEEKEPKHDEL
ncbi:glycosyltransferase family 24 protein [Panus rudis PR-1116 ss-1]|nr:glycosyltransferase family 24 protein [Panus rudis PR-1116 ss-1]